jgi:hypothetical protein
MSTPVARKGLPFLRYALAAVIVAGAAGAAVFGFIQSREQLTVEAERERPVKLPTRISAENGETAIRVDATTLERSGIETARLSTTPYTAQVRADGSGPRTTD